MDDVGARQVLLAVYLASLAQTEELRVLFGTKAWQVSATSNQALRVMLEFIPETVGSGSYLSLVKDVAYGTLEQAETESEIMPEEVAMLDEDIAVKIVAGLIDQNDTVEFKQSDPEQTMTDWIFARIYAVEAAFRIVDLVEEVLTDVAFKLPDAIEQWKYGVLKPVQQFATYYPDTFIPFTLQHLTRDRPTAEFISFVLGHSSTKTVTRELSNVVVPYVEYVATLGATDPWADLFAWMVMIADTDFKLVVELIKNWTGPGSDQAGNYVRAMLGACFACHNASSETFEAMRTVQKRASQLLTKSSPSSNHIAVDAHMTKFAHPDDAFEYPGSPIYHPSEQNIELLDQLVTASSMMSLYVPTSLASIAKLRFFAPRDVQLQFLVKIVRGTAKEYAYRDDSNWRSLRSGARWLKNKSLVLAKLSDSDIENVFLGALLDFGRIGLVREIYIDPIQGPLALQDIEKHVIKAFREHYDSASNCNVTRGSLKTASQILQLIYPSLLNTAELQREEVLLKATHELSKYSLTLVQGVPLSPLQIRISNDPEQIMSQLLQSNDKAYLQIDDLIGMTKNLLIGLDTFDESKQGIEYRVVRMGVYAALTADDFRTAYEYCIDRLWTHASAIAMLDPDLVWQTFYAAGRYVSPNAGTSPAAGGASGQAQHQLRRHIGNMQLQMDLLARAMDICPDKNMFEILSVWQEFEVHLAQYESR
ncbi:Sec39 domain-containing protein [Lipomyces arxii]|uniref:Sec39 domain-containing protein n=1 Tax=Lipomyces arxii TaxID=56418 RepID=UPI0034CECE6E